MQLKFSAVSNVFSIQSEAFQSLIQRGCKGFKFYNTMLCYFSFLSLYSWKFFSCSFYFSSFRFHLVFLFKTDYSSWLGVRDYIHVVDLAKGHIAAIRKLKDSCGCKVRHFFILFDVLNFSHPFFSVLPFCPGLCEGL